MNKQTDRAAKVVGSKLTPSYWQTRVYRPTFTRDGQRQEVAEFYAQIQHAGRREQVPLASNDREAAAKKAAKFYGNVRAKGWDAALLELQPDREAAPKCVLTVGDLLEQVKNVLAVRGRTFEGYAYAIRKIAREATGHAEDSASRFDPVNRPWRADADKVKLASVTPAKVTAWKAAFVAGAGNDELAKKRARRSVNSYLRNAKALFSRKALRELSAVGVKLPTPLPFEGVEIEGKKHVGSTRYVSTVNAPALLRDAKAELLRDNPDAYAVVLLALGAGLRRGEIDALQWPQVDFDKGELRVVSADGFTAKTDASEGTVYADAGLLAELKSLKGKRLTSLYVVEAGTARDTKRTGQYYRAEATFDAVTAWLRGKGVMTDKPLHTLRKEFGSLICEQAGIHAASRQLRHADIATTSNYYADHRNRAVVSVGDWLAPKAKAKTEKRGQK